MKNITEQELKRSFSDLKECWRIEAKLLEKSHSIVNVINVYVTECATQKGWVKRMIDITGKVAVISAGILRIICEKHSDSTKL